jgi:hypothetical protein
VNKHADGQWQAELRMVRPIANFHTTNWTVSRLQVIALSEELKPLGHAVGGKRGRKVEFSWDRMVAEVIRCVHEEGIPSSKSYGTLASDLAEWCKNQNFKDNEIPEIDNIRKKLGVWLSLVPRE